MRVINRVINKKLYIPAIPTMLFISAAKYIAAMGTISEDKNLYRNFAMSMVTFLSGFI